MYTRLLENKLKAWLPKREVLIIYGARQVGKTTLLHTLLSNRKEALILNCEIPEFASMFERKDLSEIRQCFKIKLL